MQSERSKYRGIWIYENKVTTIESQHKLQIKMQLKV